MNPFTPADPTRLPDVLRTHARQTKSDILANDLEWAARELERLAAVEAAATWIPCSERLPDAPREVEVAIPRVYDTGLKWQRDFMEFGRNVCDDPFNGFSNANWHSDVSVKTAIAEGWLWRPVISPPAALAANAKETK